MGTVRYTTVNGEIISEKRNGVRSLYVPDPLGSTVALLDNTQTKTDTFEYWPYGEVRIRTGTTATPFQFVGTLGYHQDSSGRTYVRARTLNTAQGRWMTEDPIGFDGDDWNLYRYASNSPSGKIDYSGLSTECQKNRKGYCDSGKKTNRRFDNCACRLSKLICRIVDGPKFTDKMRACMGCINSCMYQHWKNRDTKEWQKADAICNCTSADSKFEIACCAAMVTAEQSGLTNCKETKCKSLCQGKGTLFPPSDQDEANRIKIGHALCCFGATGGPL